MSVELVVGALAIATSVLLVATLLLRPQSPTDAAIEHIDTFYGRDAALAGQPQVKPSELIRWLQTIARRLSPVPRLRKLEHQLDVAGNPPRWTLERILAAKTGALIALAVFGLLIGMRYGALVLITTVGGGAAGFFLPDLLVYNTALKRQEQLQRQLPDSMDLMTICVEAGLGFDAALSHVARNTTGALAAEFARVLQEMQFGRSRAQALQAMSERTTVPELRTLSGALVQASELGIPIAGVMREQSREMRIRRRQRAEEKAQKVTVKLLFPLVFCLLPALFIIVMGPAVITVMHSLSGL